MSFLGGLGRGLHNALGGDQLAIAQAILAGDYQAAAALRARQSELQRQNEARDAQVIGAKNMGFNGDEIDALGPELSQAARQRAAARMFGAGLGPTAGDGGGLGGEGDGGPPPLLDAAPQPAPVFAPPPGAPPSGAALTSASLRLPSAPSFAGSAAQNGPGVPAAPFAGMRPAQAGAARNLPRAQSHAQAVSLPRGAFFFAPDGSIRRNA